MKQSVLGMFLTFTLFFLFVSCKKENVTTLPSLTTTIITDITSTSASTGGQVLSDGGDEISATGVCYSTAPGPTISNNFSTDISTNGVFFSYLTGLSPNTAYYVRAYANNENGTAYGQELSFTTLP